MNGWVSDADAPLRRQLARGREGRVDQKSSAIVTFVTDNVRLVGIVGDKNLLAYVSQDKEQ